MPLTLRLHLQNLWLRLQLRHLRWLRQMVSRLPQQLSQWRLRHLLLFLLLLLLMHRLLRRHPHLYPLPRR